MINKPETCYGVTVGECWKHHSGRIYAVIGFANQHTEHPDKHPLHVIYSGENGRTWTRPLTEFRKKFTLLEGLCMATRDEQAPIPMVLHCPRCKRQHYDEGEWATRPHKTHLCQLCGHLWRPANVPTVGVPAVPLVLGPK